MAHKLLMERSRISGRFLQEGAGSFLWLVIADGVCRGTDREGRSTTGRVSDQEVKYQSSASGTEGRSKYQAVDKVGEVGNR